MFTRKQPWQKRDAGLTARMIVSFAVLTIIYIMFLSVLAYVGLSAIAIAVIAGILILARMGPSLTRLCYGALVRK